MTFLDPVPRVCRRVRLPSQASLRAGYMRIAPASGGHGHLHGGQAGGCFGCVKPQGGASGSRRAKDVVCSVASWIAAAVAVADYVKGVVWNAATTRDAVAMGLLDYGCPYLKGSGFATAAVLTLVAAALGIRSFTMLLTPAPASAAGAEPKHDRQQPPVDGVGVVGEARQNQQSAASAPPLPQGQAHAALV